MARKLAALLAVAALILSLPRCNIASAQNDSPSERAIPPIVSCDWLKNNMGLRNLVILDVRGAADYAAGHIAGSINVPFGPESTWAMTRDGLTLEVPAVEDLFNSLGSYGITRDLWWS